MKDHAFKVGKAIIARGKNEKKIYSREWKKTQICVMYDLVVYNIVLKT